MSIEPQFKETEKLSTTKASHSTNKTKSNWLEQFERVTRIAERLIWLIVLVLITTAVANFLKMHSPDSTRFSPIVKQEPIERPIPVQVDREIALALREARTLTQDFASARLDSWKTDVMKRVDNNFLDWYFSYWNQQVLGIKYAIQGGYHWFNSKALTPEQASLNLIQKEFEKRVLPPEITQATFKDLIEDSVTEYTQELSQRLATIPSHYQIPQGEWDKYLRDIALITERSEANRQISIEQKGIVATAGYSSILVGKLASKIGAKVGAKVGAKSTAKISAKLGGKLLGSVFGVGIIIWDLVDHHVTKTTQMPILRNNIEEYLEQVKIAILKDPNTGLISVIYALEKQVLKNIQV